MALNSSTSLSTRHRIGFRKRPSDAARWTRCARSIRFTKDYPNTSSEAADEGTAAHWVRQQCLDFGFDAYSFIGTQIMVNGKLYTCDETMAEHLQPGIDEIRQFQGKMVVEYWVDTTEWCGLDETGKRQGGTVDCAVIGADLVVISDLKYGLGVPVHAVGNDQQIMYLLALYEQLIKHISSATQFLVIIDQPRNSAGGGYWTVSLDELRAHGERIKKQALAVDDPDACFTPGPKQCQWCPAANVDGRPGGCPAHAESALKQIDMDFSDLDEPDAWKPPLVAGLTPERLINLSLHKKAIENLLEYAHAQALQHLMDYGPIGGQKAVHGRKPPRKWRSDEAAEAFMRQTLKSADPFNKKLKTVRQAETEVSRTYQVPMALVEQGQPKPIMVSVDDDRPALRTVESEFDDMEDL